VIVFLISLVFGIVIGIWARGLEEEDCPRRVLHYRCRGDRCDHSEVLLRTNQLRMAKAKEGAIE
jgi:hypothetical protein